MNEILTLQTIICAQTRIYQGKTENQQTYHYHVPLLKQITLTLSSGRSSRLHPVSVQIFLQISCCWSANTCASVLRGPLKNVAQNFVLTFPTVPRISCSSYLHGFRDERLVALTLVFVRCFLPGFVNMARCILG